MDDDAVVAGRLLHHRQHLLAGPHAGVALDGEIDTGELNGDGIDHGFGRGPAAVGDDVDRAASRLVALHGPALPSSGVRSRDIDDRATYTIHPRPPQGAPRARR